MWRYAGVASNRTKAGPAGALELAPSSLLVAAVLLAAPVERVSAATGMLLLSLLLVAVLLAAPEGLASSAIGVVLSLMLLLLSKTAAGLAAFVAASELAVLLEASAGVPAAASTDAVAAALAAAEAS